MEDVPKFVVTPDDREWFGRCRRAWDLGARGRRAWCRRSRRPARRPRAIRAALAVHYFPGMWSWDRIDRGATRPAPPTTGPADREPGPVARRLPALGSASTGTPLRVDADIDVHVPDPVLPDTHLATRDGRSRPLPRPHRPRARRRRRLHWLGEHRVVDAFADDAELQLDERGALACWAWEESSSPRRSPACSTPSCGSILRPSAAAWSRGPRREGGRGRRLALAAWDMIDPDVRVEPHPSGGTAALQVPCSLHRDEPRRRPGALATIPAGPDILEEGRLGGMSWGMGRGAAPPSAV